MQRRTGVHNARDAEQSYTEWLLADQWEWQRVRVFRRVRLVEYCAGTVWHLRLDELLARQVPSIDCDP